VLFFVALVWQTAIDFIDSNYDFKIIGYFFFSVLLMGIVTALGMKRAGYSLFNNQAYGSAHWARPWQIWWAGLWKKGGLFLGRSWGHDLYHNDEGHIITVGGAGGGKSTGLVIPALLNLTQGSVIVTDPSGELAAITRRHRAKIGSVVLLNPFQEVFEQGTGLGFPDTGFNPLSVIDPNLSTFKADCDVLARYLMVTDRKESGSYWNDEGAEFLSLVIGATVLYENDDLHDLTFVYRRVRDSPKNLQGWLSNVVSRGHPALQDEAERFLGIVEQAPQQWQGIASKAALATKRYAPSTPLGEHVKKNGFDAADLKRENVTVYLLVPSGQLTTALPWMNMLIGVFGIAIGRPGAARPVTLLVDEAPSLGYLPDLLPFMGQFRKVGLRVWIFTQTMAQLASDELYGQTGFKAIFGLCSIKQFFSIREPELARLISETAGERTAKSMRENPNGESAGDVGVPLIRAEKVRGLKKWQQIIIIDEMAAPIKGRLVPYFKRRGWNKKADPNPYRSSSKPSFDRPKQTTDTPNDPNFDRPFDRPEDKAKKPKPEPQKEKPRRKARPFNDPNFDRPTDETAKGKKPEPKAKPKPAPPTPDSPKVAKLKALADDPRTTKEERENARMKLIHELKKKRGR
jgi:type IV secretion system protein VirD4